MLYIDIFFWLCAFCFHSFKQLIYITSAYNQSSAGQSPRKSREGKEKGKQDSFSLPSSLCVLFYCQPTISTDCDPSSLIDSIDSIDQRPQRWPTCFCWTMPITWWSACAILSFWAFWTRASFATFKTLFLMNGQPTKKGERAQSRAVSIFSWWS